MRNDFIIDGLISNGFTKEQVIEYTTNYLAKEQITEAEAKRILQSLFDIEYTDEGELIESDELEEIQAQVISQADFIREEHDVTKLNEILKTTSMSLSELIMMLAMSGNL